MDEFKNLKTQFVELPVATGSTSLRLYFPTQNFLRLKQIVSIEVFTVHDMAKAPFTGNPLIASADLINSYLTLYGNNPQTHDLISTPGDDILPTGAGEWMQQIPLTSLHRMVNGTDPYVFDLYTLVPRNIVWEKSYIDVKAAALSATPISFGFLVGYQGNMGDN